MVRQVLTRFSTPLVVLVLAFAAPMVVATSSASAAQPSNQGQHTQQQAKKKKGCGFFAIICDVGDTLFCGTISTFDKHLGQECHEGMEEIAGIADSLAHIGWDILTAPLHIPEYIAKGVEFLVKEALSPLLGLIANWVTGAAVWVIERISNLLNSTTKPQLTSGWFLSLYRNLMALAALLILPLWSAAVLRDFMRRDTQGVIRTTFLHFPAAMLLGAITIGFTEMLLTITDEASTWVAKLGASTASKGIYGLGLAFGGMRAAGVIPGFFMMFLALFAVAVSVVIWFELVIRGAAIYVMVLLVPFAFAWLVWQKGGRWARKMCSAIVGIIFSKFVLIAAYTLAISAIAAFTPSGSYFAVALTGVGILFVAMFAPWAIYRMAVFLEDAHHHHQTTREGLHHGVNTALQARDLIHGRLRGFINGGDRPVGGGGTGRLLTAGSSGPEGPQDSGPQGGGGPGGGGPGGGGGSDPSPGPTGPTPGSGTIPLPVGANKASAKKGKATSGGGVASSEGASAAVPAATEGAATAAAATGDLPVAAGLVAAGAAAHKAKEAAEAFGEKTAASMAEAAPSSAGETSEKDSTTSADAPTPAVGVEQLAATETPVAGEAPAPAVAATSQAVPSAVQDAKDTAPVASGATGGGSAAQSAVPSAVVGPSGAEPVAAPSQAPQSQPSTSPAPRYEPVAPANETVSPSAPAPPPTPQTRLVSVVRTAGGRTTKTPIPTPNTSPAQPAPPTEVRVATPPVKTIIRTAAPRNGG